MAEASAVTPSILSLLPASGPLLSRTTMVSAAATPSAKIILGSSMK